MKPSISIIGYGRLGKLFYKALENAGTRQYLATARPYEETQTEQA